MKDNPIPHIFLVGQRLRKVDLPCLNEAQSSEINIAMAFLTYPIWFAISPTPHLYKVLPFSHHF
jgi:hypothetical protein